jgi:glycosyltransferase involved in cell wall biosynthesis
VHGGVRRVTRLRVGVNARLTDHPRTTGHGRMWSEVIDGLAATEKLIRYGNGSGLHQRWIRSRVDVWLTDGHQGLLSVSGPQVVHVHDVGWDTEELRATLDADFHDYIDERTKQAVTGAAHIITPSAATADHISSRYGIDRRRVHAVHHGVDAGVFHPGQPGGREIVEAAGGGHGVPYVLFASQLHPRKNLAALRDAMEALADGGLPHQLVIVGGPPQDRADADQLLRAATADLGRHRNRVVRVERSTDVELAAIMASAAALCLPSLYEGFGLTVLEAMACATPVVVSDRGALPEVVADAGEVVAPTAEAVAAALHRILDDPAHAERLGQAALDRSRQFRWSTAVRGWHDVLATAAADHADGPPVRA